MPIGYRNGTATFALLRGSRRGATLRARRATASRSPACTLPTDSRFGGRNRVQIVRPAFMWREGERGWQGVLGGCATGSSAGGGDDEAGRRPGAPAPTEPTRRATWGAISGRRRS